MISAENAQIIRDLSLPVLALAGLCVGIWRSYVAAKAVRLQDQAARRERFKVGMELLGHERHSVRRGAVAILSQLANNHPREFYIDVLASFAAFLAFPPRFAVGHRKQGEVDTTSDDTVAVVDFITGRTDEQKMLEQAAGYDLRRRFVDTPFRLDENDHVFLR